MARVIALARPDRIRGQAGWLVLLAVMLVIAGCSIAPPNVPDLDREGAAPQLKGARGPLTVQQSKVILDRLAKDGRGNDILERHLAIEEAVTGSPLTTGNEVLLLQDGPATTSTWSPTSSMTTRSGSASQGP